METLKQRVYFSNINDAGSWVDKNDTGTFHIFLLPKRWWRIEDWKLLFAFNKNFKSGFITKETTMRQPMGHLKEALEVAIELLNDKEISAPLEWNEKKDGLTKLANSLLAKETTNGNA